METFSIIQQIVMHGNPSILLNLLLLIIHILQIFQLKLFCTKNNLIYLTDTENSLYLFFPETNPLPMIHDLSDNVDLNLLIPYY
ncbi:unnamed protein product [Paramecium primaurelia]|uniref:Uncharacterized protein n=1 Tax=Paramecium primaurelia TaxID=5886 RepID=A0A8S1N1S6_PARPR|nr:unnamed protein product [Paramecium primaurelia]